MEAAQKYKIINRDTCKYLAIFFMFWGHLFSWIVLMRHSDAVTPYTFMPLWMRIITHFSIFCPPVMFFFIADGYKYTRDRKKYAMRLGIFALIAQPFDWLIFQPIYGWRSGNVMFTLLFGLLAVMAWESKRALRQRVLLVLGCVGLSVLLYADWMIFGVLLILFLHIFREQPKKRLTAYLILTTCWLGVNCIGAEINALFFMDKTLDLAMMIAAYLCMTVFYNGKKGKHPRFAKWFFYAFYPAHYLLIFIIERVTR